MTVLLEYLGFCYKACIAPGLFPPPILSIFTIHFNYLGFECLYCSAKFNSYIPTLPPNLEQFEMEYAHRLIFIVAAR